MELFKITCVTCGARLSVRNAALVGQILGCPRCGSMVQVAAPAGASAPSVAPVGAVADDASMAPPADDFAAAAAASVAIAGASVAVPPAPSGAHAGHPAPAPGRFEDVGDLGTAPVPVATGAEMKLPAPRPAVGMSTVKLVALSAGSALACSALAAGVLSWLSSTPQPPAGGAPIAAVAAAPTNGVAGGPDAIEVETPVGAATPAGDPAPPPPGASSLTTDGAAPLDAPGADPALPPPAPGTAVAAGPGSTAPEASPAKGPAVEPPQPAGSATAAMPAPPDAAATPDAAPGNDPNTSAAAASAPRLRIDPLEVDPEGLDLSMLVSGDAGNATALSELPADAPPERESVASDPRRDEPAAAPAEQPQEEPSAPPAAAEVLLARRYPAIKVEKMPLGRFLHFATGLSAMPVSASPQELRLAAASAATAVSVEAADATIVEILTAALKPARLLPVVEGSQIVLRRAGEDRLRELRIPIEDLVDGAGDPTAAMIAQWVPALVSPAAWQRAGGPGTVAVDGPALHVRQSERVGFETVLLLERYRIARGLPLRSKYPAKLLSASVHTEPIHERLAAPATFTFSRPTPLAEVFGYWQQELGVAVLVDWPALAEHRLAPHSRTTMSAAAASWGAGLTAALAPLELDWRVVDGRTIEITSLEKVRSEAQLGVYKLKPMPDAAAEQSASNSASAGHSALEAQVQKLAADHGASAGVAVDAAHGVLLVLAPAADQRRLVDWLVAEGFLAAERAAGE